MTSLPASAAWLPAALARAAAVPSPAPVARPARETDGPVETVATDQGGPDRHADAAWSRELFDPTRDEDPFEWLGFSA